MTQENNFSNAKNGAAQASDGVVTPKTNNEDDVKEGNAEAQRPEHGGEGGTNTSSREDQLPLLNDGATPKNQTSDQADNDSEEKLGSDADVDRAGEPSV